MPRKKCTKFISWYIELEAAVEDGKKPISTFRHDNNSYRHNTPKQVIHAAKGLISDFLEKLIF